MIRDSTQSPESFGRSYNKLMSHTEHNPYQAPQEAARVDDLGKPSPVLHRLGFLIVAVSFLTFVAAWLIPAPVKIEIFSYTVNTFLLSLGAFGCTVGFVWLILFAAIYSVRRMRFTERQRIAGRTLR